MTRRHAAFADAIPEPKADLHPQQFSEAIA
jgi:hypothetical protein